MTDCSSVNQRLCRHFEGSKGVWCEEDGCVFNTVFCSIPTTCLSVKVKATNSSNVQLQNKILFFADKVDVTEDASKKIKEEAGERAIPHDFVTTLSAKDLSRRMRIKKDWGKSWKVEISKNPRFYFLEKSGWDKFVRENFLGDSEFLTFTHKGKMRFKVNIFNKDGKEMLQPRQNALYSASASRVKTENREGVFGNVKREEVVVVSSELSFPDPGTTTARSNRRGKRIEAERSQTTSKKINRKLRFSPGASSSSFAVTRFTVTIQRSYFQFVAAPKEFSRGYMEEGRTTFKIYDENMENSWDVGYVSRKTGAVLSGGWTQLAREYPLDLGYVCNFTLINPGELRLDVSKP